jgi:hypothetical protein
LAVGLEKFNRVKEKGLFTYLEDKNDMLEDTPEDEPEGLTEVLSDEREAPEEEIKILAVLESGAEVLE